MTSTKINALRELVLSPTGQKKGIYIFKLEKVNGNLQAKENQIHILLFTFVLFTGKIKMFLFIS